MTYDVSYSDGALLDALEAQRWYEKQTEGLGARFSDAVARQAKSLHEMPARYRIARNNIHVCTVPKFPYELYFQINTASVVIIAVHAVRQDPSVLDEKFIR